MAVSKDDRDTDLVDRCLSGSEHAWTELYSRFQRLVGMVVKRRLRVSQDGVEDVTQEVFMVLMSALKNYDSTYSLQKYVCTIAERVCVDHYRFSTAAKRDAEIEPFDDLRPGTYIMNGSRIDNQEDELIFSEDADIVRRALRLLGAKCRELLKLRYYEELPYGKITEILGATENTLTVQATRCVRELKTCYQTLINKGARK
ncbi:MAG: sigma-70 family RNA polymerase sigma factor [Deltaproteobacteria bacterium]|nr:sigma-70 family RNA polymerase sigma factor [Deltaproteobacteria bacterium]